MNIILVNDSFTVYVNHGYYSICDCQKCSAIRAEDAAHMAKVAGKHLPTAIVLRKSNHVNQSLSLIVVYLLITIMICA